MMMVFFFSSRRRHTRWPRDWSSDVCSSDLHGWLGVAGVIAFGLAFAASLVLLFLPVYCTVTTTSKGVTTQDTVTLRSEERRVGKECRTRWEATPGKKKQTNG